MAVGVPDTALELEMAEGACAPAKLNAVRHPSMTPVQTARLVIMFFVPFTVEKDHAEVPE